VFCGLTEDSMISCTNEDGADSRARPVLTLGANGSRLAAEAYEIPWHLLDMVSEEYRVRPRSEL